MGSRAYLLDRISNFVDQTIEIPDVYNYLRTNQLVNHSKKCLSEAMLKILLSAKHTKQFDQRTLVFDDEETRYLHRFKPFVTLISPPHPTYQQFSEIVNIENFDVSRMKEIIKNDLAESKKVLEGLLAMSPEETNTEMCHDDFKEVSFFLFSFFDTLKKLIFLLFIRMLKTLFVPLLPTTLD